MGHLKIQKALKHLTSEGCTVRDVTRKGKHVFCRTVEVTNAGKSVRINYGAKNHNKIESGFFRTICHNLGINELGSHTRPESRVSDASVAVKLGMGRIKVA